MTQPSIRIIDHLNIVPGLQTGAIHLSMFGFDDEDADISPFLQNVLASVRRFVEVVRSADFQDRQQFQDAIWFLAQVGVAEKDIGGHFGTTPNAVNRWVNGRSAPSAMLRPLIIAFALDLLIKNGLRMSGRSFDIFSGKEMDES